MIAVWLCVCAAQWDNDGLWYQSDAPRHAATGLFWKDVVLARPTNPLDFAYRYFARYPVIAPSVHPPGFYLLEGAAFGVFGPSPYVGKGLVLASALMAALFLTAWLQRWVSPEAGLAGPLFLTLPGIVVWSNTLVLNVPALALGLAALYYGRLALETPTGRRANAYAVAAATLSTATILTYYTGAVVVAVWCAWAVAFYRDRLPWKRAVFWGAVGLALVLAILAAAATWAPAQVLLSVYAPSRLLKLDAWTYYGKHLSELTGSHVIVLSVTGAIIGLRSPRWRRETTFALIWLGVVYVAFSVKRGREPRYLLPILPPLLSLAAIGVLVAVQRLAALRRGHLGRWPVTVALAALIAGQTWRVTQVRVPSVKGIRDVAEFLARVAPDDAYFYDGDYAALFTFWVMAGDPGFQRRVALADKLLYTWAVDRTWRLAEFAASPEEVVEILTQRGGCRWVAVEVGNEGTRVSAARHLRTAVRGPAFEFVRSFGVSGAIVDRVDLYRLRGPIAAVEEVDMPFQVLGEGVRRRARPIDPERRADRSP
ncbi:MAG: hypothetical protein U0746_09915 [Gemmataceae bacterium]